MKNIKDHLEYLRQELRLERISYGELIELESLSAHIDKDDVELLEAANVSESEYKKEQAEIQLEKDHKNGLYGEEY